MSSLNDTLRTVLREGIESYSHAVEGQTEEAVTALRHIKSDIEAFLQGWNGGDQTIVDSKWLSDCPVGYDTIVGWLAKNDPTKLDPSPSAFSWDGKALGKLCAKLDRETFSVDAPLAFSYSEHIKSIKCYPEDILVEWFTD